MCVSFKTKTRKSFVWCSSIQQFSVQLTACLRDLVRHFKTEPTETVAFCFGIPENTVMSYDAHLKRF
jgi:hypothetical protein